MGLEVLLGAVMAIGYVACIQPSAPRYHRPVVVAAAALPAPVVPQPVLPALPAPVAPKAIEAKTVAVKAAKPPVAKKPGLPLAQPTPARQPAPLVSVAPVVAVTPTPVTLAVPAPPRLSPEELIRRGMAALNAREWPAAVDAFEAARSLQPGNPDLGYLRGMALENLGQPGAAIDAFRLCTSGPYAQVAKGHVKTLLAKIRK